MNGIVKVADARRIYPARLERNSIMNNLCLLGFFKAEHDESQFPIWRYIPEEDRVGEEK